MLTAKCFIPNNVGISVKEKVTYKYGSKQAGSGWFEVTSRQHFFVQPFFNVINN